MYTIYMRCITVIKQGRSLVLSDEEGTILDHTVQGSVLKCYAR